MPALNDPSFALAGHPQGDAPTDFYYSSIKWRFDRVIKSIDK